MDLDKTHINPHQNVTLVTIISDWINQEHYSDFFMQYPRDNDTIAAGLEGYIKYAHGPDGYGIIATVYEKYVYIDYEEVSIEASDPEFFTKLKAALSRHQAVHANCKHIRNLDD